MTKKSAIQRMKELDVRGAVLFEKAKEQAFNNGQKGISSTLFIEIGGGY